MMMASIHCLTYNHEKYIAKALDGFLEQRTNFPYEILIHDDASTDGTQDIIREYERRHPDIIKPIYQTENQYAKGVKILREYNFPRATGKYLAFCEGDDYWSDKDKLQKQVDALEAHPECSLCTHFADVMTGEGEIAGSIPAVSLGDGVVKAEDYLRHELRGWASQTSSFLVPLKWLKQYFEEKPRYCEVMLVGDFPLALYLLTKGDVYFINEHMSRYRFNSQSGFRAMRQRDPLLGLCHCYTLISGMMEYNKSTGCRHDRMIKAYIVDQIEKAQEIEKTVLREYDAAYFEETYQGKLRRLRYFIRRKTPHLHRFLLWGWNRMRGGSK